MSKNEIATFAGGCFWCMEPVFDAIDGVISTAVGYTGGHTENPSYEEVCSGRSGHAEVIQIVFDPVKVSYKQLLDLFWHNIDPTTHDQQFCDIGQQYRTAIFYHNEAQKQLAESSKEELIKSDRFDAIATEITPASKFYPAEGYHQKYYKTHSYRYNAYSKGSGRKERLSDLWD